ncbi:uncharacterized protein LOC123549662 [Mercenaria mercenaria]|uniref:uncharacterized protein LOC123549662 n=1 Tax=Mercenaria mercenaria TaxID=6596 RepID=UPI00234F9711|nr:uncharacterized protein LOC123549662 [Mercenaria mercenaria]XP_053401078.1 uncharacterized protein LOC123549662 [Mercenaria mercenaria]XP_053401079.1 uncharacterized protein LOC123549662 [Mercenaria mercenaria]XP_053401080.1 uncharacterized protein LOC123549662 [Mercenaria mercenaria]XP_053401081.1 uncharacterized protein LOC123549662 [Mercenaria mercenaria]
MAKRYYVRNTVVPFEEDFTHEFKGHRNICVEDLPPWTQESKTESKPSRRAVSRVLSAFLNTGKGGTVYLGVIDSGEVKGLQLSADQKMHVIDSVNDVMSRYTPPVKKHRYSIKFVPVCDTDDAGNTGATKSLDQDFDPVIAGRPHVLRQHNYCWCDRDAVMKYNAGIMLQDYIIEIKVKPWDGNDSLNKDDGCGPMVNIHPIHDDEEGNCFFRRQASLVQYTMTELARLTRHEVDESCQQKIASLKREITQLQRMKQDSAT